MNCCNDYGDCNQGRNCPARAAKTPPTPTGIDGGNFWAPVPPPQDLTLRDHAAILALLVFGFVAGAVLVLIVVTALYRWLA